ncbi:MAG TPA: glycosyltransferase [Acidimicrobiales bacterium]|nr:glycosyltransferase [Acidimicrobiales bacterium]
MAAVIPARNEEPTVGSVVAAARRARLVDEVIVVDNGSSDATAAVAAGQGARVVSEPLPGKGEAMRTGVASTAADVIVFLDADLVGLVPDHVDALVEAVLDGAGMACGLFDRGPVLNPFFVHLLPALTGERALRRELFEALTPEFVHGYRIEAGLNSLAREEGVPVVRFVCPGLWHRPKEKKLGPVRGFVTKVSMLLTAVAAYVLWRVRRRPERGRGRPVLGMRR